MARSRTRMVIGSILLLAALAVILDVVIGLLETGQGAVDAAEVACRERGLQLEEVTGRKSVIRSTLVGRTAEIQFRGRRQNRPATITVTLRKPLHLMGWETVAVRED